MVIVFPMLVSQSVSENVIPGIAKTIEAYLIVNHMSDIMDNPEVKNTGFMKGFRTTKKGWFAREGINILEISDEERARRVGSGGTKGKEQVKAGGMVSNLDVDKSEVEKLKQQRDDLEKRRDYLEKRKREEEKAEMEKEKYERQKADEEAKRRETSATAKLRASDYKTISLEPSYVEVETTLRSGAIKRELVGIKVVPYRVHSSEKLSRLIMHDVQLKSLNALMVSFGRKVLRGVYRLLDKWSGRLKIGGLTVTGDPRRDIIMARTGKNTLGIIVLNKNEDIDERFLQNVPKINRLFRMGWGNIIIADDVSRTAYFCMRKFGGVCQVLNYHMMYQSLGQLKVYDSLEDAQRQNSSLFKVSKRASKVFSEWVAEQRLLKYLKNEDK
ncbi:MAG: hypothetical protein ACFFG0_01575 [Candidatus Thorarchaeota archaeon]